MQICTGVFLVGQVDRFAFSLCENSGVAAIELAASDSPPDCHIWSVSKLTNVGTNRRIYSPLPLPLGD